MTPRQYRKYAKAEKEHQKQIAQKRAEKWHVPLKHDSFLTLGQALDSMAPFKLSQGDIPLVIKLVENPKYDIGLFAGNVDLHTHDCIHILLGRGILLKDEAFVIGYTMGSTKKMFRWRKNLFMFCAKHLYPEGYKFSEEERLVFNIALEAGKRCLVDLSEFDFKKYEGYSLKGLRLRFGIDKDFLKCCYEFEKGCFLNSPESQRLV